MKVNILLSSLVIVFTLSAGNALHAQGTAFTYAGNLNFSGAPANGTYDFQFYLRDALSGGNPVGATNSLLAVPVTNGLFGATLDFGTNFPGTGRWLEIVVRPNGGNNFTILTPRQPILTTPYAIYASTAGNAYTARNALTANIFSGSLSGNVTGGQGATIVSMVGGLSASGVATGANAANAATSVNVAGTIVRRASDGSFTANGLNITNLATTHLTGLLQPAQGALPMPSIFYYGAKGGTNDDSAAFQAAEAAGMPVYCPPTTTYTFTNLAVTHNNFEIIGENTVLKFATGCQGNFISVATNVVGFQLRNVILDGQMDGFQSEAYTQAWYETAATNIVRNAIGYRTGLFASAMQTNGIISHVTAQNFSDAGFRFTGGAGSVPVPRMASVIFDNDTALNNWIGVDYTNDGEYMLSTGYQARQNGRGANIAAGNTVIVAASFEENGIAVVVNGGFNPAHGVVSSSTLKHDVIGFIVGNTTFGFEFANCSFDAEGPCFVTNFSGLNIHGGTFQPNPGLIVDGTGGQSGVNRVEHTSYDTMAPEIITVNGGLCAYNENYNIKDFTGAFLETNVMRMAFTRPVTTAGITNSGTASMNGNLLVAFPGTGGITAAVASIKNLDTSTNSSPALSVVAHGNPQQGALNVTTAGPVSPINTNNIATFNNANQLVSWLDNNGNWYATGNFNAHTFVNLSDRNAKENFQAVSSRDVLNKVAALPITTWDYKEDGKTRHLGPMAQDFYAAFGLGQDDRHITTVDESGVALTAIQGLNAVVKEKDAEIAALEKRLSALETVVHELALHK